MVAIRPRSAGFKQSPRALPSFLVFVLLLHTLVSPPSTIAQTSSHNQATLVARCVGSGYLRVQAFNPGTTPATLTRENVSLAEPSPAELLALFPIEIPGETFNDPALTWDIPDPGIWFQDLFTTNEGLGDLDGWQVGTGDYFGSPPPPANVYDDLKPCQGAGVATPANQYINRVTVLECKHGTVPSALISAKDAWQGGYPDDDDGCDIARGSTYGVIDADDSNGEFNWGLWTVDEYGRLTETERPLPPYRDYLPTMMPTRDLELWLAEGSFGSFEGTIYQAEPLIEGICEPDQVEDDRMVCFRIAYIYPSDWEPAARVTFLADANPVAQGLNGIFQNYDVGLRGFVVYCESVPADLPYFAYCGFWGELIEVNTGHFFPRAQPPGDCYAGDHNGYTISSLTETKSDVVVPAACGTPCATLVSGQNDASTTVSTQYYTKLNEIPGRKWIERYWIGNGAPCDAVYTGHCYKVYISVPQNYASDPAQFGIASVEGSPGTTFGPLNQTGTACSVSRTGSYSGVYSGITCTGFAPGEKVEFRWDSASGPLVTTATTTTSWNGRAVALIRPIASATLVAGPHTIYAVGDLGSPVATASYTLIAPKVALDKTDSRYNGVVVASIDGYVPGSTATLYWDDNGPVLGTATVNSSGVATISFNTPNSPYGDHTVRVTDSAGKTATTTLRVIPRALLNETQGPATISPLRVYCYGFTPGDTIETRFYNLAETSYTNLGTMTADANGRGTRLITLPANAELGTHKVLCKIPARSGSTTFTVTALGGASEPTPKPTKTPSATATATATVSAIATSTATSSPTETATLPPKESPTSSPTVELTPLATEIPSESPTPVETQVPQPTPTTEPEDSPTATSTPSTEPVEPLVNVPFTDEFEQGIDGGLPSDWVLGTSDGSAIQVSTGNGEVQLIGNGAALMLRPDHEFDAPTVTGTFRFDAVGGTAGLVFGYQDSSNWSALVIDESSDSLAVWTVTDGATDVQFKAPAGSVPLAPGDSITVSVIVNDGGQIHVSLVSPASGELHWSHVANGLKSRGLVGVIAVNPIHLSIDGIRVS